MTYYHVRITRRSDRTSDCLELDLSEENLRANIVEPYKAGKKFLCGGNIVDPFDIEAIQINKTPEPSASYLPTIRARNKSSDVLVIGIPDEWYVTEEGEVVTRGFINTAPGMGGMVAPEISTNKMTGSDERFMWKAIEESKKSKDENDGRFHPKVGVIVVKGEEELAAAHRGEFASGDHAEFTALERKLVSADLTDATIYTTLEPCTSRGHRTPCAHRIIQRRVSRVVIGVLDPNPSIRGGSVYLLKQAGIQVDFAKSELENVIKTLNKAFLEQQMLAAQAGFDVNLQLDSDNARAQSISGGVPVGWTVSYTFYNDGTKPGRIFNSRITVILNPQPSDIISEAIPFGPKNDFLVLPNEPVIGSASVGIKPKVSGLNWTAGLKQLIQDKQLSAKVHIDYSVGDQAKRFPKKEHLELEAELFVYQATESSRRL